MLSRSSIINHSTASTLRLVYTLAYVGVVGQTQPQHFPRGMIGFGQGGLAQRTFLQSALIT